MSIGGGEALRIAGADGGSGETVDVPAGVIATIAPARAGLEVRFPGGGPPISLGPSVNLAAVDSGAAIRLLGREYRGTAEITATSQGVLAANILDIEEYLAGVVGAEMGRRGEQDLSALRAQAVVSRTIAVKNLGRWRLRGYDLLATVADQAYAGKSFETPTAMQAVEETRGEIVTFQGLPIDAFFHSTCAGRTAAGTEVFAAAERPYLRAIRDVKDDGQAWCAISPRFRWSERWTGEVLARTLRETLPLVGGSAEMSASLTDLRVLDLTATGRVARFEVAGGSSSLTLTGPQARILLRTPDGAMLRSANFNLQVSREGGRIVQLTAEGGGAGHGVGMCQWGALGRARVGFSYQDILSAYFPGTEVGRFY